MLLVDVLGMPYTARVHGEDHEFARLPLPDYARLEGDVKTLNHAVNKEYLDECGIAGAERYGLLVQFPGHAVTLGAVREYIHSSPGAKAACKMALKRAGKSEADADLVVNKMDMVAAVQVALTVVGFTELDTEGTADPLTGSGETGSGGSTAKPSDATSDATPQA